MDFSFTEADEKFRMDVRHFFESEYPQDLIEKMGKGHSPSKSDYQRSERALDSKGWVAVNWPKEAGGTGWSSNQKYIFDEELERAGALNVVPMGLLYVGPVIYTFGTDEQKAQWLPGILNSTTFWAQGYSEPGSGSDLASLQASAVPDGDDYIVNGTKIWTSLAQHADWIFCLLRTDNSGKKQEGITFLLIDMATPGITVKPIITIDGKHSLNQVEFVDVRVPQKNRIGEEGKGWTYANYLLGHERTSYAHVAGKRKQLRNIREVAKKTEADGTRLINDPTFVAKLSALEARLDALELTVLRVLASVADGGAPGEESSILKVIATELAQDITELGAEAFGPYAQPAFADSVVPEGSDNFAIPAGAAPSVAQYLGARAQSIYGGSNEIQKNIIAKRILGL